jgi:hypothetical protein
MALSRASLAGLVLARVAAVLHAGGHSRALRQSARCCVQQGRRDTGTLEHIDGDRCHRQVAGGTHPFELRLRLQQETHEARCQLVLVFLEAGEDPQTGAVRQQLGRCGAAHIVVIGQFGHAHGQPGMHGIGIEL